MRLPDASASSVEVSEETFALIAALTIGFLLAGCRTVAGGSTTTPLGEGLLTDGASLQTQRLSTCLVQAVQEFSPKLARTSLLSQNPFAGNADAHIGYPSSPISHSLFQLIVE